MFLYSLFTRPRSGPVHRARLILEVLDQRDAPSDLGVPFTTNDPYAGGSSSILVDEGTLNDPSSDPSLIPPDNQAPQITSFTATETTPGQFRFAGTVVDESPAGMIVTLNGVQSAIQNYKTTVQSDGSFSCLIQLLTDGTDAGTVQVQTVDGAGLQSNVATVYVIPTVTP